MELPFSAWLVIFPYCMGASALGTLVGLGGGAFVVPLLVLGFGVPLKMAVTAVTFSLFPSAALSTIFNIRRQHIDYLAGVSLEIPTLLGAVCGTYLTSILPVRPLEFMFGFFLIFMGSRIFRKGEAGSDNIFTRLNRVPPLVKQVREGVTYEMGVPALGFFGYLSGVLAGLFGIGGGIIKTPVMLRIFKMPARRATATSMFMIMFTSATASFSHWRLGNMDWRLALPLGTAFFCGSLMANSFGNRIKSHSLEKLLGITLIAAALAILLHASSNQ